VVPAHRCIGVGLPDRVHEEPWGMNMAGRFEIVRDGDRKLWFRLTDGEGRPVVFSGVFEHRPQVAAAITAVREIAATAPVVDRTRTD
jgi:uncharacterized protein YegP (UPF0339 family)